MDENACTFECECFLGYAEFKDYNTSRLDHCDNNSEEKEQEDNNLSDSMHPGQNAEKKFSDNTPVFERKNDIETSLDDVNAHRVDDKVELNQVNEAD